MEVNISNVYNLLQSLSYFFYRKKHEWCAVCFLDKDFNCNNTIWFNKGPDNRSVTFLLPINQIITKAKRLNAHYIITMHNHPLSVSDIPSYGTRSANIRVSVKNTIT